MRSSAGAAHTGSASSSSWSLPPIRNGCTTPFDDLKPKSVTVNHRSTPRFSDISRCPRTSCHESLRHYYFSRLPSQLPLMAVPFHQGIGFGGAPHSSHVEMDILFAGQHRIVEPPGGFSEIGVDKKRLVTNHHITEQRFIRIGRRAEGPLVVELQRPVAKLKRPPRVFHRETEREPFTGLQGNEQPIRWNAARVERSKDLCRRLTEGHRNLGQFARESLSGPEIKWHAFPSPIMDLCFQGDEGFGGGILGYARLFAITGDDDIRNLPARVLAEDNVLLLNRCYGIQHL